MLAASLIASSSDLGPASGSAELAERLTASRVCSTKTATDFTTGKSIALKTCHFSYRGLELDVRVHVGGIPGLFEVRALPAPATPSTWTIFVRYGMAEMGFGCYAQVYERQDQAFSAAFVSFETGESLPSDKAPRCPR